VQPPSLPLPDKPSIVVLPFVNMSKDPEQEYFSDGITEDITADLSKLSGFFVIASNSARVYKGKAVDVKVVSRELGVRYVLEGSVRKADSRVRINAQLVDGLSATHVWAESYDRELKDIFALQDEVRQKIVLALKVKLTLEEQERFKRAPTDNLEAYDYLLRGAESLYRGTKEANAQARQLFERAIALDPKYAGAYAWLGWTYFDLDSQNLERAFELAQKAIALDDSQPDAHHLLSWVYLWGKNQPEQALAEAERAITLDPNYADGYWVLAQVLNFVGRPQEAIGVAEKALRLDPRGPNVAMCLNQLGLAYLLTGRLEEAIATLKQVLVHNSNFSPAYSNLAFSYLTQWGGQLSQDPHTLEQALAMAQKAVALHDSSPFDHIALGAVYLWQKKPEQARAEAERAITLNPNLANGYALLAGILNATGKPEEAIGVAEKAVRLGSPNPGSLIGLGHAYCLTGRYEEAIATLKKLLTHYPNDLYAHLILAIAYSEVGREEEARAAAAEVLRISPKFSLEVMKQRAPNTDPAVVERQLAALRAAGLK
jgi:TolB-like protein/Flp pilus assembly protein TadD